LLLEQIHDSPATLHLHSLDDNSTLKKDLDHILQDTRILDVTTLSHTPPHHSTFTRPSPFIQVNSLSCRIIQYGKQLVPFDPRSERRSMLAVPLSCNNNIVELGKCRINRMAK